jgi:hypothetical protein
MARRGAVWTFAWLAWNTLGPQELRFDPAPAFVLWLFSSNLIQLHLVALLTVGQGELMLEVLKRLERIERGRIG